MPGLRHHQPQRCPVSSLCKALIVSWQTPDNIVAGVREGWVAEVQQETGNLSWDRRLANVGTYYVLV